MKRKKQWKEYSTAIGMRQKLKEEKKMIFQKSIDTHTKKCYNKRRYRKLGVAQLVARYLGVVEAAGSSPVTQTISSVHN